MKVKVGNIVTDGEDEPVMVILTDQDKENIRNMAEGCKKYCMYPGGLSPETIKKWMAEV